MEKIAILGGTFNPIHNGHLLLARASDEEFQFDRILVIPTNDPPHKVAHDLCSNEDRFEMCRLATENDPKMEVLDLEFQLGGASYTYRTLRVLKERYPDAEFFLLTGSDMIYTFRQWKNYEEILRNCTLVGASRNHEEHEALCEEKRSLEAEGFHVEIIENDVLVLSSTEIREKLANGEDVSSIIDPKVEQYIREHHLFQRG